MNAYIGLMWVLRFKNAGFYTKQLILFWSKPTTVCSDSITHYLTRQVHIKSPRIHLHTPPNPTRSRWYDHEGLKADYKPDSPTHYLFHALDMLNSL